MKSTTMKKTMLAVSLVTLLSANAQADTLLGLYIGGQVWNSQADGMFGESTNQATFDFGDETQGNYFIALEHPLPFLPNVKIASTTLDNKGITTLNGNYEFNNVIFNDGSTVDTTFNASYVDYTFYYELFDNDLLTFDFGLTARDIDADINLVEQVTTAGLTSKSSVSGVIPMLYASTIIGLPFTGFNIFAEANFLSFDSQTVYDYQVGVSYELLDNIAVDLNLTAGYRSVKLDLNDLDNFYSDLSFDGVFAGAVMHF